MNMGRSYPFNRVTSFPGNVYLEVGLLDDMVAIFLIFSGAIVAAPVLATVNRIPFSQHLCQYLYLIFLIIATLACVQ